MKNIFIYVGIFICFLAVVGCVLFGLRLINQTVSPVKTFHPEEGITCVQVSSTDGVALSCVTK